MWPVVLCWGTGDVELRHWMGQEGLTIVELRFSAVSNLGSLDYCAITDGLGTCARGLGKQRSEYKQRVSRIPKQRLLETCHIPQLSHVPGINEVVEQRSARYAGRTACVSRVAAPRGVYNPDY
jgi:hypothetical protein